MLVHPSTDTDSRTSVVRSVGICSSVLCVGPWLVDWPSTVENKFVGLGGSRAVAAPSSLRSLHQPSSLAFVQTLIIPGSVEPIGSGVTKSKYTMSSNALFDEESSDDEEMKDTSTSQEGTTKRTIKDDDDDEEEAEDKKGGETGGEKDNSASALFGDDDDSDDTDEKIETKTKEEDKEDSAMDVDDADADDAPKVEKTDKQSTSTLFGEDSSDDDEGEAKLDDVVGSSAPASSKRKQESETGEEGDASANQPSTTKHLKPPQNATVLESSRPSKDISLHMTKLPNLVAIQPAAFDENSYLEKEEEEQYKGYVHNMIRWRYKRDAQGQPVRDEKGNLVRESNTRLIQWSDGSYTLHIGKEALDIQTVDSSSKGFAGLNGYMYLSQKATFTGETQEENAAGGTVLECMGAVTSRLIAKPSSLQSEAHKSLTVAVRQRTIKKARIAEYVTEEDPEKAKQSQIRDIEDLEKASARKSSSHYRPTASRHRQPGMNRRYLEEDEDDDDYETTNIGKLKKGIAMDDDMDDYGEESDDDGYDDTFRKGRDRKRRKQEEEEEEEEEELVFDEESDEEDGTLIKAHSKSKRSHQAVVDDDDDED